MKVPWIPLKRAILALVIFLLPHIDSFTRLPTDVRAGHIKAGTVRKGDITVSPVELTADSVAAPLYFSQIACLCGRSTSLHIATLHATSIF